MRTEDHRVRAPGKLHYRLNEVCELTDTQPYVLKFWEQEFPQLAPERNRTGQRLYRKRDIDLVRQIKHLLYEKEYTIAAARLVIEGEPVEEAGARPPEQGIDSAPAEPHPATGEVLRSDMREDLSGILFDAEASPATRGTAEEAGAAEELGRLRRELEQLREGHASELSTLLEERDRLQAEAADLRGRLLRARHEILDLLDALGARAADLDLSRL